MNRTPFRLAAVLALLLVLVSCDHSQSRIVGKWKVVGESNEVVWDFSKNGTVNIGGAPGHYTLGGDQRIKIQTASATFVHQLEFAGDRMIWKDPDGKTTELTRVK